MRRFIDLRQPRCPATAIALVSCLASGDNSVSWIDFASIGLVRYECNRAETLFVEAEYLPHP